jgi:hypothetical protein
MKVTSSTLLQCKPAIFSMKTIFLLSALTASLHASPPIVPVYGCEKYPLTAALTNFTFTHGTSTTNTNVPSSVKWQAPALGILCSASSTTNSIGTPGTFTSVRCNENPSDQATGSFKILAADGTGSNATISFITYAQCAADIFGFGWEAVVPLLCASDAVGSETCVAKGNTTANVYATGYIPHVRPPPPPPWSPQPPQSTST